MIPLDMVGLDGSWRATIVGRGFHFSGGERLVIPAPEVLAVGRNQVLMNSHAPTGEYVSLLVDHEPCTAAGRRYSYDVKLWISPAGVRERGQAHSLRGCAKPRGERRRP